MTTFSPVIFTFDHWDLPLSFDFKFPDIDTDSGVTDLSYSSDLCYSISPTTSYSISPTTSFSISPPSSPRSYPSLKPEPFSPPKPDTPTLGLPSSTAATCKKLLLTKDYRTVLTIISSSTFPHNDIEEVRQMWLSTIYALAKKPSKPLSAVDRYRARKRHPFPPAIQHDDKILYNYKESTRTLLTTFFEKERYPTPAQKHGLAEETGLSYVQIATFFKNKRMRARNGK